MKKFKIKDDTAVIVTATEAELANWSLLGLYQGGRLITAGFSLDIKGIIGDTYLFDCNDLEGRAFFGLRIPCSLVKLEEKLKYYDWI